VTRIDSATLVYDEWAWQRDLLRAFLDAAENEPIPAGTLKRTWERLASLADASRRRLSSPS